MNQSLLMLLKTIIGASIFGIASMHFYWLLGGERGLNVALPQLDGKTTKAIKPGSLMTLGVAIIFLIMSFIALEIPFLPFSNTQLYYLRMAIAIIFILRSVGDFKYFGIFRKIKTTPFAFYDTRLFTPLAFFIGFSLLLTTIFS